MASPALTRLTCLLLSVSALHAACPAEVPTVDFTVTNPRKVSVRETVRASIPVPEGAIPGDPPRWVIRDGQPAPVQATVITRHGDGSARRVMLSFPADLPPGITQFAYPCAGESVSTTSLASVDEAGADISAGPWQVTVQDAALRFTTPGGQTLAELRAFGPDLTDPQPPTLAVIDNGPFFAWLRWRQDGSDYTRELDIQAESLGNLRLTQRILRHLPGNGWTPDFGFELAAPGASATRLPSAPVRFMGLPVDSLISALPELCASITLADETPLSLANPLALKQRRGTIENLPDAGAVRVRFSRLEPVQDETQNLQLQEGAWRVAEIVLRPDSPEALAEAIDAPLLAKASWQAYDAVYHTGPPLKVETPLLRRLAEKYVASIASLPARGDDWGSLGGLERYNHCQYIIEDYFRAGDPRLREVALDYSENYRNFSVYWGPNPDYYGGGRYPADDRTRPWPGSFRTRHNNAVTFCTKGYHTFWMVYEETGDPRFREAAEAQAEWSAKHVTAGVNYTRCIGQVTDFVRMYEYTGRQEYLDQAIRLWGDFQAVQDPRLLFTEGGAQPTGDDLYIPDDRFGYAHPYVKSYIVQYATNALPELLRHRPDDQRLRDTIIACNDWMVRVQTPGGGWSYPGPTTAGFAWNTEYCHGLMEGYKVEPKDAYLDAVQRDLRAVAAVFAIHDALPTGITPWEYLTGMSVDDLGAKYTLGTDRDRNRDFTDGRLNFGFGPDSTVYFQVLLRDYLKHRPEASLFTEDPILDQILSMPTQSSRSHAQSGDPSLRISIATSQSDEGLTVRLSAQGVYRLADRALAFRWVFPDGLEESGAEAMRLFTRGGRHEVKLVATDDGREHIRTVTLDVPVGPGDLGLERWPTGLRIQAESFVSQGGGESPVHVREAAEKVASDGGSISHWDPLNAWVEWNVDVPQTGQYFLLARYACPVDARRVVSLDATVLGTLALPSTGGYSSTADDWRLAILHDASDKALVIKLPAGRHTLRLTNDDGKGCNLDYLELARMPGGG